MFLCISVLVFVYLYICVFVYLYICVFVYLYICVFVHLCICTFVSRGGISGLINIGKSPGRKLEEFSAN